MAKQRIMQHGTTAVMPGKSVGAKTATAKDHAKVAPPKRFAFQKKSGFAFQKKAGAPGNSKGKPS